MLSCIALDVNCNAFLAHHFTLGIVVQGALQSLAKNFR